MKAKHPNHIWSYDFAHDLTHDGGMFRNLNIIDEYTTACLAVRVKRILNSQGIIDALSYLYLQKSIPKFIRSDNGPEFIVQSIRDWITLVGSTTVYIEPASPWENGYYESFNARFKDELQNGKLFYTLREEKVIIEQWQKHYPR